MKKSNPINKHAPYLALIMLISVACVCFGQSTTTPPPVPQAKVIPPPTATTIPPTPTLVATDPPAAPQCPMTWVLPGGAGYTGELSKTGETPFEWTQHPDASGYQLVVTQPDGSTIPYQSDDVTKSLYMENYKLAGEYKVTLSALDANKQILCSIDLTFTKPAVDTQTGNEGNDKEPKNPTIIIPEPPR